jgi:LacI family gluconate utilization system Gnt-I transcriptional repressor
MSENLTLKDVALAAGVSEMTASRAMRNATDVSVTTREKVKQAAAAMGYVPNHIAGALASNKVNLVGVVIPSVKSYVFSEVLDGISSALKQSMLRPVFGLTDYNLDTEEEVIRDMLAWRPAGLIVAGLEHSENAQKILRNTETPLIEIMDVDGEPIDSCVGISHYRAGFDMALAIVAKGHTKIGFLGTKMPSDYRATKRFNGFIDGLKSKNINLMDKELYASGSTIQKGKESTAAMLQRNQDLQCIYCSTDVIAIGAVMHCMAAGISIPDQLGIAGFNDLSMTSGLPIDLATTSSLRFDVGKTAAELILKRSGRNADSSPKRIEFTPSVKLGNSI